MPVPVVLYVCLCELFVQVKLIRVDIHGRAVIDRPISRESSASPNLVGDRAAHPVCDHYLS